MAVTTYNENPEHDTRDHGLSEALSRRVIVRWEMILYVAIFLLAVFTRFYMLGDRAMSHDESLHTYYSYRLYTEGEFNHTPLMHGPILFHANALAYALFGDNDFSARIYTSVLGVLMVLSPLLFRRWLGRWGTIIACVLILISPLLMYYNRYIREDTPAILASILMVWAILMYLNGPAEQRRKPHWLYILSAAMIWNLGSKETAFLYVAAFGLFLMLYWFARMAQQAWKLPGKVIFYGGTMGLLLGGVAAMGMYIIFDITPLDDVARITPGFSWFADMYESPTLGVRVIWMLGLLVLSLAIFGFSSLLVGGLFAVSRAIGKAQRLSTRATLTFFVAAVLLVMAVLGLLSGVLNLFNSEMVASFVSWSIMTGVFVATVMFGALYWASRQTTARIPWRDIVLIFGVTVIALTGFVIIEELSHISRDEVSAEVMPQPVPGEEGTLVAGTASSFTWAPIILAWVLMFVLVGGLLYSRRAGWWDWLHRFPELDVLMIMGSLILPWLTAIFIVAARGTPNDFSAIGASVPDALQAVMPVIGTTQTGQLLVGFLAWLPMMIIAVVAGLTWNWKRYIVSSLIFHAIFAFFFTTMFSNINGLATGMVYSLQYWMEQQAERRGNQPQYYYFLIVMPMYEFLPIIGSVLAMIAGTGIFWRRRLRLGELVDAERARKRAEIDKLAQDDPEPSQVTLTSDGEIAPVTSGPEKPKREDKFDTLNPAEDWTPLERMRYIVQVPFLLFVSWWAVLNLIIYTLAGEKMPWLGTHMTVPMIFLTAWYFGGVLDKVKPATFREHGWKALGFILLLMIALFRVVAPPLGGEPPFAGVTQEQLGWTYNWLLALGVAGGLLFALYRVGKRVGDRHMTQMIAVAVLVLAGVLTFRSAWMASFINYDYATEFLVYAHATPGTKIVMEKIDEISRRTTGGNQIVFAYDNKLSWPGVWYFREYPRAVFMGATPTLQQMENAAVVLVGDNNRSVVEPLLEERFQRFDHTRMWWPMMDYFNLTAARVNNAFDLSPTNTQAAGIRRGLFDIWWNRDYTRYGQAVGKDFSVANWPVRENQFMYVRRDIAAQVWNYGVGGGAVAQVGAQEVSACIANWQDIPAVTVFNTQDVRLRAPIGVAVGEDRVYVADAFDQNSRIVIFNRDGEFIETLGQRGASTQVGAFFERPHSVAVAPDGTLYVVDTWNYRIRAFAPDLTPLTQWGTPLTAGINAQVMPVDGFWGPRDAVVDAAGRVYVADTGNKRVRVYTAQGEYIMDIGRGGSGAGQLDEPSGLAIHPDGRLFVADTWNRRISVFTLEGIFIETFNLRAWYDELGNRPYLAVDPVRDYLYITDPDAGRVLVYSTDGECVGAFGRLNRDNPNNMQFATVGGIAVDRDGFVYVTDVATGRVLKFPPFPAPEGEALSLEDLRAIMDEMDESDEMDGIDEAELPADDPADAEEADAAQPDVPSPAVTVEASPEE